MRCKVTARGDGNTQISNTVPSPQPNIVTTREQCYDGEDNDGNGRVDEDCPCDPNAEDPVQSCYPGLPSTTQYNAPCQAGEQVCVGAGEFGTWSDCEGYVLPEDEEDCDTPEDDNCNGVINEGCIVDGCTPTASAEDCATAHDDDCNGVANEGCDDFDPIVHDPKGCNSESLTVVAGNGQCEEDQAVYMIDDWDVPAKVICCPLPASDILLDDPPVVRRRGCLSEDGAPIDDEVMTGLAGGTSVYCSKINTDRYALMDPSRPCYFGNGASSRHEPFDCPRSHPTTFTAVQRRHFGSDGCTGYPFGSLIVNHGGKYCKNNLSAQLVYTGNYTGDPPADTPRDDVRTLTWSFQPTLDKKITPASDYHAHENSRG